MKNKTQSKEIILKQLGQGTSASAKLPSSCELLKQCASEHSIGLGLEQHEWCSVGFSILSMKIKENNIQLPRLKLKC